MVIRVMMLAWEYPPDHIGGLGRHVCHLSEAMANQGIEITVLTRGTPGKPLIRHESGVEIVSAVPYELHPPDFVTWAAQFNVSLMETCNRLFGRGYFDLIHAHDWIVAYAARAVKHSWQIPLVATLHATECGRQKGLHTPMQHHISETEWWLCYEAWKVITCSKHMKSEVMGLFSLPEDKIQVIPNGISDWWFEASKCFDPEPLLLYVGRLVPEKGPHILLQAMSGVLTQYPTARLVLAGEGPLEGYLQEEVFRNGLGKVVEFAGHLGDSELMDLYSRAWVGVFPSSYEPFGIVALEAMASGTPCIVGDTGGLSEIVENEVTGLKVTPDNPEELSRVIKYLLSDKAKRSYLAENAKRLVRARYSWKDIARSTLSVYRRILRASGHFVLESEIPAAVAGASLSTVPSRAVAPGDGGITDTKGAGIAGEQA
ncbi:MAG: glycosyltransferase family 4 protein [Bacillota bacterium]|jgi:glycogen(starch) synthase